MHCNSCGTDMTDWDHFDVYYHLYHCCGNECCCINEDCLKDFKN